MRGLLAAVVEDLNLLCNAQHTASIDNLNQGELEGGRNWVGAEAYQSKILSRHNSLTGRTNCPKVPFIISVRNSFFLLLILLERDGKSPRELMFLGIGRIWTESWCREFCWWRRTIHPHRCLS